MTIGISIKEYLSIQTSHCEEELSKLTNASEIWKQSSTNAWSRISEAKPSAKFLLIAWCIVGKSGFERRQLVEQLIGKESAALSMQTIYNQASVSCFSLFVEGSSIKDIKNNDGICWQPILPMMKVRKGSIQRLQDCDSKGLNLAISCVKGVTSLESQIQRLHLLGTNQILQNTHDAFPHSATLINSVNGFYTILGSCQTQGDHLIVPALSFSMAIALIGNLSASNDVLSIEVQSPIQFF